LWASVPNGCSASSQSWRAAAVEGALLGLGRLADAALDVRVDTATKVHGCLLAPLGARPAVRMALSITARGTGVSANWRTVRRVRIVASKASARRRRSASSRSG
jgi:hypothetical protein